MAEVTKGFKMSEEAREMLNTIIDASGLTDKDWIEAATNLWTLQDSKSQFLTFKPDIDELSLHTSRINELVLNIISRSSFEKSEITRQTAEQVNNYLVEIDKLNSEITNLRKAILETHNLLEDANRNKLESQKTIEQLENSIATEKMLIDEYKNKNDVLTGLLNDYKGSHDELLACKNSLLVAQNDGAEWQRKCVAQESALSECEKRYVLEIERIIEKLSVQSEREILKLETDHQHKMDAMRSEFSNKLQSLYSEIEVLRKSEFDARSEKREAEIQLERLINASNS